MLTRAALVRLLTRAVPIVAIGSAAGAALAGESFVKVIPPGAEQTIGAMLGGDAPLAGGCKLDRADIDRTKVVATYRCGDATATIELHAPSDPAASSPAARTAEFALVARGAVPAALLDDVALRIRAREGSWRWISAEAPGLGAVGDAPVATGRGLTPEQSEAFVAAVRLYREGKAPEAFERFRELAKVAPGDGVLGMVVASLASSPLSPEIVDRFTTEADAHPGDTLAQFVAGVAAHYTGHRVARTRAEKAAYYERAIRYLTRTRPRYDFEPRVYVYLGVSHFRLGHQKEAEALIEAAIPLAKNDPDVYYCRGEIFQRADIARSIADIRTYLDMAAALEKQGVPMPKSKHERVERMLAHLEAVRRGEAKAEDLFDPLPDEPAKPPRASGASPGVAGAALVALAGAIGAWVAVRRRKRRTRG